MPKFDQEKAISAIELQQLIADWGYELDMNGGLNISGLCTEDCNYLVGGVSYRGHAAVNKFYADRGERVRAQQKDGIRTQRHTITNLRVSFEDKNRATGNFILVNYSAEGKAPVFNLVGPTILADCRMEFRRETDGEWLIALFDSAPTFIGNDPFLNAAVVKK